MSSKINLTTDALDPKTFARAKRDAARGLITAEDVANARITRGGVPVKTARKRKLDAIAACIPAPAPAPVREIANLSAEYRAEAIAIVTRLSSPAQRRMGKIDAAILLEALNG